MTLAPTLAGGYDLIFLAVHSFLSRQVLIFYSFTEKGLFVYLSSFLEIDIIPVLAWQPHLSGGLFSMSRC